MLSIDEFMARVRVRRTPNDKYVLYYGENDRPPVRGVVFTSEQRAMDYAKRMWHNNSFEQSGGDDAERE